MSRDWNDEVVNCSKLSFEKQTKLWSFEVKRVLRMSNVRECYFQAVSNSTWANFGFLVCEDIVGDETLKELRMLFGTHGIGVLQLDAENPSESQLIIPARERYEIDWHIVNRIASENDDFKDYIKRIRQFYQTGDFEAKDWD